jgi:TusE/DsrC/DsvC family sulfur relay protein
MKTASGTPIDLNEEGFLRHPEIWDREVAATLALEAEGIEALSEKHWAIVHYIRGYWLEKGMAPMIRALCQQTGVRLREVYELFPSGPAKGACKVAGLPKPDGCV